ncbi:rRNA maturation RNase YbeY [Halanaerobiaceae bacterium Z-7014]|uniref:Endoribonuclease YbeY n=2 Tax=Halonatronomonas betaini TaxID=2778430 RepID=A0A931AQ67_9FIRM|nr:rRNA maturation RNase YbeY [Halonatronomonas betaini]
MLNNLIDDERLDSNLLADLKELADNLLLDKSINDAEISITFVGNSKIKELNKTYRDKDEVTDVLSFPIDEELLGEVIISLPRALEQAKDYGHSLRREVGFLMVHGLLHILGYNHKSDADKAEMRKAEEELLEDHGFTR